MQDGENGRYLSRIESAKYLGVGIRTLDTLVSERRLPAAKVRKRVLLDRADLDRFIAAAKQPAA